MFMLIWTQLVRTIKKRENSCRFFFLEKEELQKLPEKIFPMVPV